jgi:two-component system sensor histidine kinase YesM
VKRKEALGLSRKFSLSFKLLFSFCIIIVTLIATLFYGNMYAMNILRLEVSNSTERLLLPHISQIDESLRQINLYLLRMKTNESTYSDLAGLSLFDKSSSHYFFSKQRVIQNFEDNAPVYPNAYAFFVYSARTEDIVVHSSTIGKSAVLNTIIEQQSVRFTSANNEVPNYEQVWELFEHESSYYLMRKQIVNSEVTIGALVNIETLITQLTTFEEAKSWQWIVLSEEGQPLTETQFPAHELHKLLGSITGTEEDEAFGTASIGDSSYLLVHTPFQEAPAKLLTVMPEKELMSPLLFFQRALYVIPFVGVIILAVYFWFIRSVFVRPMKVLIRGMSRIGYGDLTVRLQEEKTKELAFVSETFNRMVLQIKDLKIDVYEEKLKKQQAEFKHLQAQIKPHFYLNSLNIIYSLSVLGENQLVEKMTEHLADYFRFITQAHRESIKLKDEINHIVDYLEIQKLRFPDKLTYSIEVPVDYEEVQVLPLIVQPFVENAIIHGMQKGKKLFQIDIKANPAEHSADHIEICIKDNGIGFSPDRLKQMQEQGYADGEGTKSVGIWNVHHRLKMKYGKGARVSFDNGQAGGAVVSLIIPRRNDEDGQGGEV